MDTLVALGSTAAFGYSTYSLFAMTGAQVRGDMDGVMQYMHEFYFETAAMILALITGWQDAGGEVKRQDYRCIEKPDEAGSENSGRPSGWH